MKDRKPVKIYRSRHVRRPSPATIASPVKVNDLKIGGDRNGLSHECSKDEVSA